VCVCVCVLNQLGKIRMKVPCRSVTCDHLQCFDAITYLRMNEKKPTWFCPVCDRRADYSKLIIDGFVVADISSSSSAVVYCITLPLAPLA